MLTSLIKIDAPEARITSLQLAEITGKRHDHILRDIRAMLAKLSVNTKDDALLVEYVDTQGRKQACYKLSKPAALTLLASYDADTRFAAFTRLELSVISELLESFDAQDLPEDRFVYVAMENESHRYKIGISKQPEERVATLSRNHPEGLTLMAVYKAEDVGMLSERRAHRRLEQYRLNGEWFSSDAPVVELDDMLGENISAQMARESFVLDTESAGWLEALL